MKCAIITSLCWFCSRKIALFRDGVAVINSAKRLMLMRGSLRIFLIM